MGLVKSSFKIFSARMASAGLKFLGVVVFSQVLGAAPLGTYYPFLALLGIIAIPADFGISSAMEKRISEGKDASKYLGSAVVLKSVPLAIISILILLTHPYVVQYLGADLTFALIATLFASQAAELSLTVLRGELRVGETAAIEVFRPIGWLSVGYALYLQGYGVHSLVYGYLVGSVLMLIVGWWKVSTPLARPTLKHTRSLFDYGRFSVISSVGGYFYSWMDVAMLSMFVAMRVAVTRRQIGAYENAWQLSLIVILLSQSIATAIFPQVSQWSAEGAFDRIEDIIPIAILPALLIVIPAFVGTVILSRDLLRILFGPEFTVAWLALIILTGEKILQAIHAVLGRSLQAIDRPDLAAYATVISILVNLVLNVVLIWKFGIIGAAIATTVSFTVNTVLHARYLGQFVDIDLPIREALWSIVASAVMGVCVYGIRSVVKTDTISELGGIVCVGMLVYAAVVLVYSPIREMVQRLIRPVVKSLV